MAGSTSYTVSARLNITGNAAQVLGRLGKSLDSLDGRIKTTEGNLNKLIGRFAHLGVVGKASFDNIAHAVTPLRASINGLGTEAVTATRRFHVMGAAASTSVRAASGSFGNLRTQLQAASLATGNLNTRLTTQALALTRSAARAANLATQLGSANTAAAALAATAGARINIVGGRGRGGGAGGGGGGGGERDGRPLWRRLLGVPDAAAGQVRAGVHALDRGIGHVRSGIGSAISNIPVLGGAIASGALLGEAAKEGGHLLDEAIVSRTQVGPDNQEWFERLRRRAQVTTGLIPGTTDAGNIRAGMEIRTSIPDREQVLEILPYLQGLAQTIGIMDRTKAGPDRTEKAAGHIAKFLNLIGAGTDQTDPTKFSAERYQTEAELLSRNFIALRNLDPREWVNYAKRSRTAGQLANQSQKYGGFTASGIQAMGGDVFGTAQAAFVRQFSTGIMTKEQAKFLKELGLIAPDAKGAKVSGDVVEEMRRNGELTDPEYESLKAGGTQALARYNVRNADLAAKNQEEWRKQLMKLLAGKDGKGIMFRGHRINLNDASELDAIAQALGGQATARGFLAWLFDVGGRQADIGAVQDVKPGAGQTIRSETFSGGMASMVSGFQTLLQNIGESTEIVRLMNEVGAKLREWAEEVRGQGWADSFVLGVRDIIRQAKIAGEELGLIGPDFTATLTIWRDKFNEIKTNISTTVDEIQATARVIREVATKLKGWMDTIESYIPGTGRFRDRRIQEEMPEIAPIPTPGAPATPRAPGDSPFGRLQLGSVSPAPTSGSMMNVNTAVYLDGRQIAEVVSRHQGSMANSPATSPNRYDTRRGVPPAGALAWA